MSLQTVIAIIGGGPAGLMLAIELGCRGVPCVLLEERAADAPLPPKANATSARTMEHYRRRGFADAVRAVGLTADHPQDVAYVTRLAGIELARFRIPSRADAAARRSFGDLGEAAWPTPELPHRGNQMYIEPILRREAARWPSVSLRFGTRATALRADAEGVEVDVVDAATGAASMLHAAYAVGCDGPRSRVRDAMGVGYAGVGAEQRAFFGGQMLSVSFRSPDLGAALGRPAWTWWLLNPEQRAVLVALDGADHFLLGIQLKPGQGSGDIDCDALFATVARAPIQVEVLDRSPWTAGHTLVAEHMSAGRLFIAGDAAHLFTPTGGMGYNTSIDDAVNLGWKLAAVCQGWAPPALLASYEAERRPIAERNTAFARAMAASIGGMTMPADIEDAGPAADAARAAFAEQLLAHARAEFNIPGIQLGLRYGGPIVATDSAAPPADAPNRYEPGAHPGTRAPHVALADGSSILDRYGRDFTLLHFSPDAPGWAETAASLSIPLLVLPWPEPATHDAARALHGGADCVLIRPDHHIAWRGGSDADAAAVLTLATGAAIP